MARTGSRLLARRALRLLASAEAQVPPPSGSPSWTNPPREQKDQGSLLSSSRPPSPWRSRPTPLLPRQAPVHRFHTTPPGLKKRKVAPAADSPPRSASNAPAPASPPSHPGPNPQDPLDFSSLRAALAPQDAHYRARLQTILHGGRFNPSVLGALPVGGVKSGDDGEPRTFPLGELAQVVPRSGRAVSLLVNERAYIKPIMSAVQSSRDFNQQPQRSADNDLELLLRVEPARKEDLARRVREAAQAWRDKVRQARARHDKVLKGWARDGTVLRDAARRAERELQRVQDGKMREIEGEEGRALRELER